MRKRTTPLTLIGDKEITILVFFQKFQLLKKTKGNKFLQFFVLFLLVTKFKC